jgi:hypothetical protein
MSRMTPTEFRLNFGGSRNSDFWAIASVPAARRRRAERLSVYEIHDALSTTATQQSCKKRISRGTKG